MNETIDLGDVPLISESRTLFIPLLGKAEVSRRGIILDDEKAEEITGALGLDSQDGSMSKWLAYFLSMRARVFDEWLEAQLRTCPTALVVQIGCGLDSRCVRVEEKYGKWVDCDLSEVVEMRRLFYEETDAYALLPLDATNPGGLAGLPSSDKAVVALEGLSMYLDRDELFQLLSAIRSRYESIHVLMDAYTELGAKLSRIKNPVKSVGVETVFGFDDIEAIAVKAGYRGIREKQMTPSRLIDELSLPERLVFSALYAGSFAKGIYRLYEFEA